MIDSTDVFDSVVKHPVEHLRVLGPPGSGKTRLLIERYKHLCQKHPGSSFETNFFVLTYSRESQQQLVEAVVAKNSAHVGPLPVIGYSQLARDIVARSRGADLKILDEPGEQILFDTVNDKSRELLRSDLRHVRQSDRFRTDTLRVFDTLLQNNVDEETLGRAIAANGSGVALLDIHMLYKAFCDKLKERNLATYRNISWIAAERWEAGLSVHPVSGAQVLLIDDFQDIDPGQFALLKAIAPPGGSVKVNVFGDPLGSVFGHHGTQHRFLMDEFLKSYNDAETFYLKPTLHHFDALGATVEGLLGEILGDRTGDYLPVIKIGPDGERDGEPGGNAATFGIETVRDEMDEVAVVVSRISSMIASGERRPSEIAILTNEKHRYEALLKAVASQRGIRLDTGRDERSVFGDFLYALLVLFDSLEDPVALRSIMTSPLGGYLDEVVVGERSSAADDGEQLRLGLRKLMYRAMAADRQEWMNGIVESCVRSVCDAYVKDTGDESVYAELCHLLEAWKEYVDALARVGGENPSVRVFVRVSSLFSGSRRMSGSLPESIGVYSCREVKGRYFPVVFVVGCSELLFPSATRRESIVSVDALKDTLAKELPGNRVVFYSARDRSEQLTEEYHQMFTALTRSTGELYVTAPEMFSGNDHPAPAAVLKESIPERFYSVTPDDSKIPPQVRFAADWVLENVSTDVSAALETLSPAGAQWRAPQQVDTLFEVGRVRLSKSSIESYVNCPRQFFYRKILRVPDDESLPARVGTFVHKVMEKIGPEDSSKKQLHKNATPDVIRHTIDKVIQEDGTIDPSSLFGRALRFHIGRIVGKFLEIDRENTDGYVITGVETPLGFTFEEYEFVGRIDRVEKTTEGGSVIVDFKTGFPTNVGKTGKNLRNRSLIALKDRKKANWQVPLYAWGYKSEKGELPRAFKYVMTKSTEDPVEVTVFFGKTEADVLPDAGAGKRVSYLLDDELEEIMKEAGAVADEIISRREKFEKSEDNGPCRFCSFSRLCGREV